MPTAKESLLDLLAGAGVDTVFGNPGTTEFPLMDALGGQDRLGYRLALHDAVAVGMAHGHTLATGCPAMVNLHAGPGVTNAMGNIYNAAKSGVPLFITAGQIDTRLQLYEPPLWADLATLMRPVSKWAHEVRNADELVPAARRALKVALTPPKGPVFLALPYDILDHPTGGAQPPFVVPSPAAEPDAQAVDYAAQLIARAERPVVIVGDGLANSASSDAVLRLAEEAGCKILGERIPPTAPVPTDHPLYHGTIGASSGAIGAALGQADVLILAGARRLVPVVDDGGWELPPGVHVVQVDDDPWELGKILHYDVGILSDPAEAFRALADAVAKTGDDRREAVATRREALEREGHELWAQRDVETAGDGLSAARVVRALREHASADTVVFDESLTSTRALLRHYPLKPEHFYGIKGTSLGWGLPAAVGHQIGDPSRPVVAFMGDGATLYSLQALWSAAHYDAPLTTIVVNNRSYKILKEGLDSYRGGTPGHYLGMDIKQPTIDYQALAQGFGVAARQTSNSDELDDAIRWAMDAGPAVLEVLVDDDA